MANIDIKTTMDTLMDFDLAKKYIRNFGIIEQLFDRETISYVLPRFQLRDFATFEYIPTENLGMINYHVSKEHIQITEKPVKHYITEYAEFKGRTWESMVFKSCLEFIVPDNYQLKEKELLKKLLVMAYPYLNLPEYYNELLVYHADQKVIEKNEFYLPLPNANGETVSLYVPFNALREKNPRLIIDRHTSYHKAYYGTGEATKPYLAKALSVLEFDSTKEFFEHVRTGK